MSLNKFTALLGLVCIAFSCKNEYVQSDPVCFERDVYPIIVSNCTQSGCHNAVDREKGRDYSTYEGILRDVRKGNYQASKLYTVLVKSSGEEAMPPKPYSQLSDEQILTIATWIEEGAGNDTCVNTITCDTIGAISYTTQIRPILTNWCNSCHAGTAPNGGGISLSSHAGVKAAALDGSLLGSVKQESGYSAMPQTGNKLSNCDIAKIQKWVDAGAPSN